MQVRRSSDGQSAKAVKCNYADNIRQVAIDPDELLTDLPHLILWVPVNIPLHIARASAIISFVNYDDVCLHGQIVIIASNVPCLTPQAIIYRLRHIIRL